MTAVSPLMLCVSSFCNPLLSLFKDLEVDRVRHYRNEEYLR